MAKVTLSIVLMVFVCIYLRAQPPISGTPGQSTEDLSPRTVRLLVILAPDENLRPDAAADLLAVRYGLEIHNNWYIESLQRNCYVFDSPAPEDMNRWLESFDNDSQVESVQLMQLYSVASTGTNSIDPYFNLQHSFISARIDESHQISTGRNVKVAVIDTGLDRSHYDLRDRVEAALNFVDADQAIEIVEFHATAVMGIIGAAARNGRGIIGIAPDSRLYSLRACWESLPGTSRGQCSSIALARALDWAISNEMKVVNMSLQGSYDPLVSRLIIRAVDEGLVVVAATDLGDGQLSFPASMSEVIAVSSHDPYRAIDYTRNAGKVFVAPGEEILTTMPDNTYDFVSGSSFASAHISGIVALLVEHVPAIDAHTVKAVLRSSTRIANWTILVDACTALATVTDASNCRPLPP